MAQSKNPSRREDPEARAANRTEDEKLVVPVVSEELDIERRQVTTGVVRISKQVHERQEIVNEVLMHEDVQVVHVPIGTQVESPPSVRTEGSTLIIPVIEEILVVEKRLMLKEEIHITMQHREERTPQEVTLRSEEVVIERDAVEERPGAGGTDRAKEV